MVNSLFTLLALPVLALCAPHSIQHRHEKLPRAAGTSTSVPSGQVVFVNNCDYKVSVQPFAAGDCESSEGGVVEARSLWNDTLTHCSAGNGVLKVYQEGQPKPMQFEYGIRANNIWYDMSFIDCVANGDDFSACAGESWAIRSNEKCQPFACSGGPECCTQGYCDPWATGVYPAPNTGCGPDQGYTDSSELGLVIELCHA